MLIYPRGPATPADTRYTDGVGTGTVHMRTSGLNLALPEINQVIRTEVATRPDEAKRWLASLPFLNVSETGRLIYSSLKDLNRLPIEDDQRLRLMELYRKPVSTISRELQKNYIGLSVPIPRKDRPIAEQVQQFQVEMAHGYLRVAQNSARKPNLGRSEQNAVALAIQRGIRYLTESLLKSYELYTPHSNGSWRDIHQLYRCAERLGVTETPVPDPLNGTIKHSSVAHVYKQALLLAFSNPFRLPARMLNHVHRYLDRWASYAKITLPDKELQHSGQFLINLHQDCAGFGNTDGLVIAHDAPYRLLTTHDLTRVLHSQYTILRQGQTPPANGLEQDFFSPESIEMLRCLIGAWSIKPKRVFGRVARHAGQFELAIGIENINYFVNGAQEFVPSNNEVGPPRRNARAQTQRATLESKSHPARTVTTWQLVDESATGIALRKRINGTDQLRIGELLSIRQINKNNPGKWNLAVVRWIKSTDNDEIEMGIQRIGAGVEPRVIQADTPHDVRKSLIPALFLPSLEAMKQPATLVAPRGVYRPDRVMVVDDGYRSQRLIATRLLQINRSFEQFEFKPIDA